MGTAMNLRSGLHRVLRRANVFCIGLAAGIFLAAVSRAQPVPVDANGFFHLNSGRGPYVGYAPDTYDPAKPISLFVWMHGCGGQAEGDMWAIAPYATRSTQSYVAISLGGRDGACWQMGQDAPKVLAAIDHVSRYFRINPRKIYIGGYSSGGDLAYRVGFLNSARFAAILGENTDPFRDTGTTGPALMAAARWKIRVAHLAHLSDSTYPIATVRANLATLTQNGFPVVKIERPGTHYDPDTANSGTTYDLIHDLLPYLDAGWTSPGPALTLKTPRRVVTRAAVYAVRGVIPGRSAGVVTRVEVKVGKAPFRAAKRTRNVWTFKARLKPGRNLVIARAVSADRTVSPQSRTNIIRR